VSTWVHKKRVGVFRGGEPNSFSHSMKSGSAILSALKRREDLEVLDVNISPQGEWLMWGMKRNPGEILSQMDQAVVTLRDQYGEGGQLQQLLDQYGVRYHSSNSLASALAFNKALAKDTVRKNLGIRTPQHLHISSDEEDLHKIIRVLNTLFLPAYVVKPLKGNCTQGFYYAEDNSALAKVLEQAFQMYDDVLVEQYIGGADATCILIDGFRNQFPYTTPVIEVLNPSKYVTPATFNREVKSEIETMLRDVHDSLGLRGLSKADFRVTPAGEVFFLEVNSIPDFSAEGVLSSALLSVGSSHSELVDFLIS